MASPAISVIMSAYNAAQYVRQAVESILSQTFGDFEFIVVDDGSTDSTREILSTYRDERIRVLTQASQGPGAARNRALQEARAEFVAIMDADDISMPDRFEREMAVFRTAPDVHLVTCRTALIDGSGRPTGERYPWKFPRALRFRPIPGITRAYRVEGSLVEGILETNFVAHPSVMYRRNVVASLGGYDPRLRRGQDFDLWFRMARAGCQFAYIDDDLVLYRRHPENTSVEMQILSARSALQLYEKCLADGRNNARLRALVLRAMGRRQKDLADLLMSLGRRAEARRLYAQAAKNAPEAEQIVAHVLTALRLPNFPVMRWFRRATRMRIVTSPDQRGET